MAQNYDNTDLLFTSRGDYFLLKGDLGDTEYDPLRSLYQEVYTRIKSSILEWEMYESLGAGLSDFVGELNNKTTAESIKLRIISSLTRDGFVNSGDISVMYAPIDHDKILFRISIKVAPTALNNNSESLKIKALYDYRENNINIKY